jgi:tRNA(Ile)-lysidine synthase
MNSVDPIESAALRFAAAMTELTGSATAEAPLGIAVSGGPDSMALLILAHRVFGTAIRAATVDHKLRPEASDEAAMVARWCCAHNIDHQILTVNAPITGNIQSSARTARYALLEHWATEQGCGWIATAHHADDQLETLMMRIRRGSGIRGLSGIRARNGRIIRPVLGLTKSELEEICKAAGVAACNDPSNKNTDFDRVRMRDWLAKPDTPFDPITSLRSTAALAQANEALEWMAQKLLPPRISRDNDGAILLNPDDLPAELQRRLLMLAIAEIGPTAAPRGLLIDRALAALKSGDKLTVGDILCTGGKRWKLEPAPPRRT